MSKAERQQAVESLAGEIRVVCGKAVPVRVTVEAAIIRVETVEQVPTEDGEYQPLVLYLVLVRSFSSALWHIRWDWMRGQEHGQCTTALLPYAVRGLLDALISPTR